MKIAVVTDTNSNMSIEEADKIGVKIVPMPFMINGEEYFEEINLTQKEFYKMLTEDANVSTSQPSLGYIASLWDELLETNDAIIYIPMSSGLSKSCESAMILAESEYKGKVYVVDNQRISITQKHSVLEAVKMRDEGLSAQEIYDILMKNRSHSTIYIMVDTLKYLRKGGRITPAAAMLGSVLRIKPILQIHGDKLDAFKKTRTIQNAKAIMLEQVKKDIEELLSFDGRTDNIYIDVAHTNCHEEANAFAEEIKEYFNVKNVEIAPLSLSVSCHVGPGALAIAATKQIIK